MTLRRYRQIFHRALSERAGIARVFRAGGIAGAPRVLSDFFRRSPIGQEWRIRLDRGRSQRTKEYSVELPAGLGAQHLRVQLSIPQLPSTRVFEFAEHVTDDRGRATEGVLATARGGFAISRDLGSRWSFVPVSDFRKHDFLQMKALGDGEFLVQAALPDWNQRGERRIDLLVVDENGDVRAQTKIDGSPCHGCRAVDVRGGTVMYAEYPYDPPASSGTRFASRVFRSRDRGRTWSIAFERSGRQVRHFHYLQVRPGSNEWWLTSGDRPDESNIWLSADDGENWENVTASFGPSIRLGSAEYSRSIFRLTDIAWRDGEMIWGTDDLLSGTRNETPGARIFGSAPAHDLAPYVIGRCRWPVRNLVEVGDTLFVLTQGSIRPEAQPADRRPGVYLLSRNAPDLGAVHLFDAGVHSAIRTAFTYSKASRAAKDGVFFTLRSGTDVFPFGHKILKWEVSFS